jgi:SAM-dependent methyltransferase
MSAIAHPLPKESRQSQKLYSKVANEYDAVFERAILAEDNVTRFVQEYLDGRRVLDLACGNGRWLDRFSPREYVGLDLNKEMLAQARCRYPHADFITADMTLLPFADASFEGVASLFGAMGHLSADAQRRMVAEVSRVLAPGGVAIFTNGNLWSPFGLPVLLSGGRVRIEGVRVHIHSSTPRGFAKMLSPHFHILRLESYDHSYLPLMPLKFAAFLVARDYRPVYAAWMDLLENTRFIPTMRWFGKQLVAVCQRPLQP